MVDISHYTEMMIEGLSKKIHALEEKLNTAEKERDEARRELMAQFANVGFNVREVLATRGWSYLYKEKE